MSKQTSSRVSSIAAILIDFRPADLIALVDNKDDPDALTLFCDNVRILAASALSQDEISLASEIDEPVETGGHSEDSDGPIPFRG